MKRRYSNSMGNVDVNHSDDDFETAYREIAKKLRAHYSEGPVNVAQMVVDETSQTGSHTNKVLKTISISFAPFV